MGTCVSGATDTLALHGHDAQGRRVRSTLTRDATVTTSEFDYSGISLRRVRVKVGAEDTATITIARDEAGAPSIGTYTGPGAATTVPFVFVTTDRGDVIELVDAAGEPFALYAYGAYGDPTSAMSTGTVLVDADLAERICELQPLRYAGYVYDGHSGLYQCNARYYDPSTARFLSKDPVRADGEMSGWMYCGGDPVGCVDPSGLASIQSGGPSTWRHSSAARHTWFLLYVGATADADYLRGAYDASGRRFTKGRVAGIVNLVSAFDRVDCYAVFKWDGGAWYRLEAWYTSRKGFGPEIQFKEAGRRWTTLRAKMTGGLAQFGLKVRGVTISRKSRITGVRFKTTTRTKTFSPPW